MPGSPPARTGGGSRAREMGEHDRGTRTLYRMLRRVVQGFVVFLLFIVSVVAWRKLIVEGRSVMSLEYGEYVSLGILLAIAAGLWVFAARIHRELR